MQNRDVNRIEDSQDAAGVCRISVIIPHFNRADLLHQTLKSLQQQQQCSAWEAVVVDDGSEVAEWARAQAFSDSRVKFYRRTDGIKGPSRCRNLGLEQARGAYVMFLDSDDLVASWCIETRLQWVQQQRNADAWVFPVMLFRNAPGDLNLLWNRLEGEEDLRRFLLSDPPWHTSSTVWRSDVIRRLGGFNERVMYGDDADLHIRALIQKVAFRKQCAVLPDIFIRRSETGRITNTVSDRLLESRLTRLREGTRVVQQSGSAADQRAWQGQYFVECEYLLFRGGRDSGGWISRVLAAWRADWPESHQQRIVAAAYLRWARLCRWRAYWGLRVARRLAMLVLPVEFFPRGGRFEAESLSPSLFSELRKRLGIDLKQASPEPEKQDV